MSSDTCVICASGPSLCKEDIDYCRDRGWSLAAVNNSWELAKDSKIIYAADYRWWAKYHERVKSESSAELYTASAKASDEFGLNRVFLLPGVGYSNRKGYAHTGSLSGFQAIQIAGWEKPSKIILLGYDMQHTGGKTHFHGDHEDLTWPNCPNLDRQIGGFSKLAEQSPIEIINCTRETALECFPRMELDKVV